MNNELLRQNTSLGDIQNILNSWIGSENLIEKMMSDNSHAIPNYPPYDLIKYDESKYRIVLAIAGFTMDEIDIILDYGKLIISNVKKPKLEDELIDTSIYIRRGIAKRNFNLVFKLSEHMQVDGASLKDGLLNIELSINIPKELQPRKIEIWKSE